MKVAGIVGARPQFIKAAALHHANQEGSHAPFDYFLIHTGQHYDANMSALFFEELSLPPPRYHFEAVGTTHGAMTGRMLEQLEKVLIEERPDWVVVFGDTNSTLAGALAACKLSIPVAHVEAGLRSFNRAMPEEINRIVADHCSDLLLTTHATPTQQLLSEGVPQEKICEVGDVMCDIARLYGRQEEKNKSDPYLLATIHRAGNTDDPERLRQILQGLRKIAHDIPVVFPVHPRTRQAIMRLGDESWKTAALKLIEPVGYLEMLRLEMGAHLILTDSGGVQKEAYFCRVPCLIVRQETEWIELVQAGYSRLVEADASAIYQAYRTMDHSQWEWESALYGDGYAGRRILEVLKGHNAAAPLQPL